MQVVSFTRFRHRRLRDASIRAALVTLVLITILPAVMLYCIVLHSQYTEAEREIQEKTLATARSLVAVLDAQVTGVQAALDVLASSDALTRGDLAAFHQQASAAASQHNDTNYVLNDATGQQLVNTLVPFGKPLPVVETAPLKAPQTDGKPTVTDLFMGPIRQQPLIVIAVPVMRDGKVRYTLSTPIKSHRIDALLIDQGMPAGWIASVADRSGTIAGRSRDARRYVGQKAGANLYRRLADTSESTFETTTKEGIEVISSFSRSRLSGMVAIVGAPKSLLTVELRESLAKAIAGGLAAFGLGIVLASRLAKTIAASVESLVAPAQALGRRETVSVPAAWLKEVQAVGDAIGNASATQASLEHRATHDGLTGLPNKTHFRDVLARDGSRSARSKTAFTVIALDLDGFKRVNDDYGHGHGDAVLKAAAQRLQQVVRAGDVVARLGGDEFAVLLWRTGLPDALIVAGKIVSALSQPYDDILTRVSASAGVAVCAAGTTTPEPDAENLLYRADQALLDAKRHGKNRVWLFKEEREPVVEKVSA